MNQTVNSDAWLADPNHPICCDTSALYYPSALRLLRQRFPSRSILLPTIAYFERQRQLRVRFGKNYRPEVLQQGTIEPLGIEIISCEEATALLLAQVTEQLETQTLKELTGSDWQNRQEIIREHARELRNRQANWKPLLRREVSLPKPCGQRCRLGDYIVAATARFHDALLLTDDRALLDSSERHPDLFPPALSPRNLITREKLGLNIH